MTATLGEPGIGDLVGDRYRIEAQLGYGGMAHVYRARDERLQRDVAIKIFRAGVSEAVDPSRTAQEMRLLAAMNHPAVVSILDAADDPRSGAYLVMELVDGEDLGTVLRAGPLPAEQARRVGADVAGALEALHARSIVHRDVKPANILVLSAAAAAAGGVSAKLTDFGIAQMIDGTRITAPESVIGTAAYLSPEQVRGERVGPASDVYALGLVLLECLTGVRAFVGSAAETAMARLARPPAIPASVSAGLGELLRRMTAIDPGARPDAGSVAVVLRDRLVGGMLAGEGERTAQTPAVPMAAIPAVPMAAIPAAASVPMAAILAAASVPLATGPVGAAGPLVPTGGLAAAAPPVAADAGDAEEASRRRRRIGMLSGLIGGFAALTATAAVVVALAPTGGQPLAPVESGSTGAGRTAAAATAANPPASAGSRQDRTSDTGRAPGASRSASASPSASVTPRASASSTGSATSAPAASQPASSAPASSGTRTGAPTGSAAPSSGGSPSGSSAPSPSGGGSAPVSGSSSSPAAGSTVTAGPGLDG